MRRFIVPALFVTTLLPGLAFAQAAGVATPPSPTAPSQTAPLQPAPPGAGMRRHHGGHMQQWHAKFDAANTTHDGHLTLAQAQAANMKPVAANFTAIDTKHRGYVTFNDVLAWRMDHMAQHLEQKAATLRAQD